MRRLSAPPPDTARPHVRGVALGLLLAGALALVTPVRAATAELPLERLTAAFQASDAGALRACLAVRSRIYLAVTAVQDDEGLYGPDQVFYLFRAFFARHPTRSFRAGP